MKLLALCSLLLVACVGRPLEVPCSKADDCPSNGCVQNWWVDNARVAANVCSDTCSSDADCGGGTCAQVGDATTFAEAPMLYACR